MVLKECFPYSPGAIEKKLRNRARHYVESRQRIVRTNLGIPADWFTGWFGKRNPRTKDWGFPTDKRVISYYSWPTLCRNIYASFLVELLIDKVLLYLYIFRSPFIKNTSAKSMEIRIRSLMLPKYLSTTMERRCFFNSSQRQFQTILFECQETVTIGNFIPTLTLWILHFRKCRVAPRKKAE